MHEEAEIREYSIRKCFGLLMRSDNKSVKKIVIFTLISSISEILNLVILQYLLESVSHEIYLPKIITMVFLIGLTWFFKAMTNYNSVLSVLMLVSRFRNGISFLIYEHVSSLSQHQVRT